MEAAQQQLHPPLRQQLGVLPDGGQPGDGELGQGDAVVPHHGHILRHPAAQIPDGPDGPHGHHVADAEQGGELRAPGQQALGGVIGVGQGVAAGLAPAGVEGQAQLVKGPLAALHPAVADLGTGPVAPHQADVPVALIGQETDDLPGGLLVVGGEGGQVVKAQLPGGVGQQDAGHRDAPKLRLEKLQVAAQKQDAQGLALPAELEGVGHLVGVLVQVVDRRVPPRVLQKLLAPLHQIGKEHIHGALDDHRHRGAGLLLEVLGVGVGLEALLLHHRQHLPAGVVGHVGVVVQHPGHGGHPHARQPRDILDGHLCPSFRFSLPPCGGEGFCAAA